MAITKHNNISWSQFEICNTDTQFAFERMCRLLFNYHFFDGKEIFHSNPNNPGIEILPILNKKSNKRISFQSKYLSTNDYAQIKHSAEMTVKHYKNEIDVLYLYCNRDLTTTSQSYKEIIELLRNNDIQLILINNQTILDQVLLYPVIATYYFSYHTINDSWFKKWLNLSLDSLGPRYNSLFNVNTKTENYLDLFSLNSDAISQLNNKRFSAIMKVKELLHRDNNYDDYVTKAYQIIEAFDELTIDNVNTCLNWELILKSELNEGISSLEKQYTENKSKILRSEKNSDTNQLHSDNRYLRKLINIPTLLKLSHIEKELITKKMLIIKGEAGVGKSQLFANASEKNIKLGGYSILLLGHSFLTDDSISNQIPKKLEIEYTIDDFFNILESIGEQQNQCIIIFFDAINESGSKEIWKTGLNPLFNKLINFNHIRFAFSLRTGYEQSVLDDSINIKIKNHNICLLEHDGFRNESIDATKEFLNHYSIPFTPSSFLQYEITNPLFLTFFCKNYTEEEFDILSLFEKVIENADLEVQKAIGFDGSTKLLIYLINNIIEFKILFKRTSLTKQEIFKLDFWKLYGLDMYKIPFLSALEKTGLLYSFVNDNIEHYYLGYNLLEDFLCAKIIMKNNPSKNGLIDYIIKDLLQIENNHLTNYNNIDIFIVICIFYAEKYSEECIYIINSLEDKHLKFDITNRYIKSFSLRKTSNIQQKDFIEFFNNELADIGEIWKVLIENSTKINHPLNAEFLHSILSNQSLSKRDYIWTTYINNLSHDEERLYQLIELFDAGDTLNGLNHNNIKLLLILFSWLLASSNRVLRDKTSKAMIEVLMNNFDLCKYILIKFEDVNDPYIIQRLYGIVFGACTKRLLGFNQEFKELAEYIYDFIFNKEKIYPDILLRDYARLIIEKYLYDFPDDNSSIEISKIVPPYKSDRIPIVNKEIYHNDDYTGFDAIATSMNPDRIDGPSTYGDFGRYVFQSALSHFVNVDIENLYHYAMQYIRDELCYSDELFTNYDTNLHSPLVRGHTDRFERIGKKYQWIAMYNILARVSDTNKVEGDSEKNDDIYKGSFEPYIRDFDPTLNDNFLISPDIPDFIPKKNWDNIFVSDLGEDTTLITQWVESENLYFSSHADKLMLTDSLGEEWILLNQYEEIKEGEKELFDNSKQEHRVWSMSHSYIVKEEEFENFKNTLQSKNFMGRWFPEPRNSYQLFNREYPWSYGCNDLLINDWQSYEINTGETYTIKHSGKMPKFEEVINENGEIEDEIITFEEGTWETVEHKKKYIGKIMPTYLELTWEEEYDYSTQERYKKFIFPNKHIFKYLNLHQKQFHGYYYNADNELVAFDGNIADICNGLLIKKKYLDNFLNENNLKLFWTCLGEKQYLFGHRRQIRSEWSGFLYLDENQIIGSMNFMKAK